MRRTSSSFRPPTLLIGVGAGTGFAPMMADISHWFVKRRGIAVVVVASGNYLAGTIWPLLMSLTMPAIGWRATYAGIGIIVAAIVLPLALMMRRRPSDGAFARSRGGDRGGARRCRHISAPAARPPRPRRLFLLRRDVDAAGPYRRLLRRSRLWRRPRRRNAVAHAASRHRLAHRLGIRRRHDRRLGDAADRLVHAGRGARCSISISTG